MKIKYLIFDVAGTLLHKPGVYTNVLACLKDYGYEVSLEELMLKHKLASEFILFPDKTSKEFYDLFNKQLLYSLGINPSIELVDEIFKRCTYLSWEAYEDTDIIKTLPIDKGVISNWDNSLKEKLNTYFPGVFQVIVGSADRGIRKPEIRFYELLVSELKCSPSELLYVGDSIKLDIAPAEAIGINTVLIDRYNVYPFSGVKRITHLHQLAQFVK